MTVRLDYYFFFTYSSSAHLTVPWAPSLFTMPCGLCAFSPIYYMPHPRPYGTTYACISTC